MIPVSYTHLDVYKRQRLSNRLRSLFHFIPDSSFVDVYKRQLYNITGDGRVEVTLTWNGKKEVCVPEFGMEFVLPSRFSAVRYYGMGPEENYCDRCSGAMLGIYETTAQQNMTPYAVPQEMFIRDRT